MPVFVVMSHSIAIARVHTHSFDECRLSNRWPPLPCYFYAAW